MSVNMASSLVVDDVGRSVPGTGCRNLHHLLHIRLPSADLLQHPGASDLQIAVRAAAAGAHAVVRDTYGLRGDGSGILGADRDGVDGEAGLGDTVDFLLLDVGLPFRPHRLW